MANLASAGSRIVAVIIDSIILLIIAAIIAMPLGLSAMSMVPTNAALDMQTLFPLFSSFGLLNLVAWLAYFTYFEGTSGQTPGKRIMGIKVVKDGNKKMTIPDAFIRTILRIIDSLFVYLVGLISVVVTEKKQRIGDMAAGTVVVRA